MSPNQWRGELFLGQTRNDFSEKTILIAGCGAEGSHVATGLASLMMHATDTRLVLADPEVFETGNLGIQVVDIDQLGVNKAVATRNMLAKKFPSIQYEVRENGITHENASELVDGVDYVVDATDVFVTDVASTLHREAGARDIPVVVPWSLGLGAAMMAFDSRGGFDEWGEKASEVATDLGLADLKDVARWFVHIPNGFTKEYTRSALKGEAPTSTTIFGNQTGGLLTCMWIATHLRNPAEAPFYPEVVINTREGLDSCTMKVDYEQALRKSLAELP